MKFDPERAKRSTLFGIMIAVPAAALPGFAGGLLPETAPREALRIAAVPSGVVLQPD